MSDYYRRKTEEIKARSPHWQTRAAAEETGIAGIAAKIKALVKQNAARKARAEAKAEAARQENRKIRVLKAQIEESQAETARAKAAFKRAEKQAIEAMAAGYRRAI